MKPYGDVIEGGRREVAADRPERGGAASGRRGDQVAEYLARVGNVALLTREGEIELAQGIEEGKGRTARAVLGSLVAVWEIVGLHERLQRGEVQAGEIFSDHGSDQAGLERAPERLEPVMRLEQELHGIDLGRRGLGVTHRAALRRRADDIRTRLLGRLLELELAPDFISRIGAKITGLETRLDQAQREIRAARKRAGMSVREMRKVLREMRSSPESRRLVERQLGLQLDELAALERGVRAARSQIRDIEKEAGCSGEELRLAAREIRAGERQAERARHGLILANQRLVVTIALKILRRGAQLVDLIQDGNIGLLRAVDRFDHRMGYRFSTYAGWWIRQSIIRSLIDSGSVIRLPVQVHNKLYQLRKTRQRLVHRLGREPTPEELGEAMYVSADAVCRLLAAGSDPLSLDEPLATEEGGCLAEVIADETVSPPTGLFFARELTMRTWNALASLSPREEAILRKRYGLADGSFHTLEDISHDFGVTRERIRQIEAQAFAKLRKDPGTSALKVLLES